MPPCRRRCPGTAGPVAHSLWPERPAPHDEPDFSTGCSPWPHPTTALTRPTTTTARFAQTQLPSFSLPQILTSPAIPTPSRFTSPKTQQQPSRPLENCEGCSVLAGVRNLGLDDPSAGCSDLHCNFGVRSRVASSGCNAQSRALRRDTWSSLQIGACVPRATARPVGLMDFNTARAYWPYQRHQGRLRRMVRGLTANCLSSCRRPSDAPCCGINPYRPPGFSLR